MIPSRLISLVLLLLPPARQEWGRAMAAELAHVPAGRRRWRFAAGVVRTALLVCLRPALVTGVLGLGLSVAATLVVRSTAHTLQVLVASVGVLLSLYAARLAAGRTPRPDRLVAGVLLAGVVGMIAVVVDTAVRFPGATNDRTHAFSILLALALAGYTVVALSPPQRLADDRVAVRCGVGAGVACGLGWTALALTRPMTTEGLAHDIFPIAFVPLVVACGAAAVRQSLRAGVQAGVWAGLVGSTLFFVINMVVVLSVPSYALTDPYDIARYPHSGFASAAAYLISDDLSGLVLSLIWFPLVMVGFGIIGGLLGETVTSRSPAPPP